MEPGRPASPSATGVAGRRLAATEVSGYRVIDAAYANGQSLLQLDQLVTDRGLREIDVLRGGRYRTVIGDRGENAKVTDLENHRAFPMAGVNDGCDIAVASSGLSPRHT